jgi:protein-tyrosine-phosphatase
MPVPLFVCHANCCRSVLAHYLYEHLCPGAQALSAGVEVGDVLNARAAEMLRHWGIDASAHRPRQLDRALCERADGIFLMGARYLFRLLLEYGENLAPKAYLFADPFSLPQSFRNGEYLMYDPSFENRSTAQLASDFAWVRDRVAQIHEALHGKSERLVPATRYLPLVFEQGGA